MADTSTQTPGQAGSPSTCPRCGSDKISRSQRRGLQEAVVLKKEGFSPYRCQECGERFIRPSRHKGHSRRHSLAGRLGIRDPKARRRFARIVITTVLVVVALITALFLFGYFTRPAPPPPDFGSTAEPPTAACLRS